MTLYNSGTAYMPGCQSPIFYTYFFFFALRTVFCHSEAILKLVLQKMTKNQLFHIMTGCIIGKLKTCALRICDCFLKLDSHLKVI